jgi:hypothetical protein
VGVCAYGAVIPRPDGSAESVMRAGTFSGRRGSGRWKPGWGRLATEREGDRPPVWPARAVGALGQASGAAGELTIGSGDSGPGLGLVAQHPSSTAESYSSAKHPLPGMSR